MTKTEKKQNCWEFKKCGREPGGFQESVLGTCTSPLETRLDSCNHGKNGGRSCWALSGTLCNGVKQGPISDKIEICVCCDFYNLVKSEEGDSFLNIITLMNKIT